MSEKRFLHRYWSTCHVMSLTSSLINTRATTGLESFPLPGSLHTILQILEVNIFEKRPIIQIVKDAHKEEQEPVACNQLNLFNS